VSYRQLLALGITGGIVPCPAALVVLLSAVALHRIAFGLFLIIAFSVGLAAVLIAIGLLMVYARHFISRVSGEGLVISRWLPITSAAFITFLGVAITLRALTTAGILHLPV
jgi:ABC-type nickel/cobalt efflux system permease component RcnA